MKDIIRQTLDETLGVIYPHNPSGKVTDLFSDNVMEALAIAITKALKKEPRRDNHPWAAFLDARARCIELWSKEGRTDRQIFEALSWGLSMGQVS
jgi:hypothetical protein